MTRPIVPEHCFWLNVAISPFDEACWPHKGTLYLRGNGYIQVRFRGRSDVAHRVAYILEYGSIPDGMSVLHSCDWRICCNPFHLFPGTQLDNMRDMKAKGRGVNPVLHGEEHGRCTITDVQVVEMRRLYDLGDITHTALASTFNVSLAQVGRILRGESRGAVLASRHLPRRGGPRPGKITDDQVRQIRQIGVSTLSYRELGEQFGVTKTQIRNILLGKQR